MGDNSTDNGSSLLMGVPSLRDQIMAMRLVQRRTTLLCAGGGPLLLRADTREKLGGPEK